MNSRNRRAGANTEDAGPMRYDRIPEEFKLAVMELLDTTPLLGGREDIARILLEREPRWHFCLYRKELTQTMARRGLMPIANARTRAEANWLVEEHRKNRHTENDLKLDVITASIRWLRERRGRLIFWCGPRLGYMTDQNFTQEGAAYFAHSKLRMMANLSDRMHLAAETILNSARTRPQRETAERLGNHIDLGFDRTFNLDLAEEVLTRFSSDG